ncbi:MAG: PLP-dependent aspartate aminotransferase family protein [Pseudomonadota bacterium]
MADSDPTLADRLVAAGRPDPIEGRHVNMPIELGSTRVFDTLGAFEAARAARLQSGTAYYGRYGNAASFKLESALVELEQAAGVTLTSSGVSAITSALLALLEPGQHLLIADNVYGNSRAFADSVLRRMQVEVEYVDVQNLADLALRFKANTAAILFEAPGSGTFEVPDIPAVAALASKNGVTSILDGTWASPVFCQPLTHGVDVLLYSGSKHIVGHSDAMLGIIASADGNLHERIRRCVFALGDKVGGQEVMLALRGLRTLALRMREVDRNGRCVAEWLAEQPVVAQVLHPAFDSCPGHAAWQRDFSGAAGLFGVVFHASTAGAVVRFVDALTHFGIGVSWGGYESLVLPVEPVRTARPWHAPGPLLRFNVGLDNPDTLINDLRDALPLLTSEGAQLHEQPD